MDFPDYNGQNYLFIFTREREEKGNEKGERKKEKSASEREQRQVYLSVAEREQIQDRKAGLKEKGERREQHDQFR